MDVKSCPGLSEAAIRMILDPVISKAHEIAMRDQPHHSRFITLRTGGSYPFLLSACWYGAVQETELSLVIFEAKSNQVTIVPERCLAYMGMWTPCSCYLQGLKPLPSHCPPIAQGTYTSHCFWGSVPCPVALLLINKRQVCCKHTHHITPSSLMPKFAWWSKFEINVIAGTSA